MGVPKHQTEWEEAQKISISTDLILAAKQQLQFLRAVDNSSICLYQGPALVHAIYRYKNCWLPLLAEFQVLNKDPLIPPLDCEWVWHCHRLNPIRYKADCEMLYGRLLNSHNVVSSVVEGASTRYTEELWNKLYPHEPYSFNPTALYQENNTISVNNNSKKTTDYDLESAVKRQSTFYHQVPKSEMKKDDYLKGALARYKGFLHLIKRNFQSHTKQFCVPTYDIDLIWHSHQLNSASYVKDTVAIFKKVLDHDDTDSDKGEGSRLANGFHKTTKQWEETFGSRYCTAAGVNNSSQQDIATEEYQDNIRVPEKPDGHSKLFGGSCVGSGCGGGHCGGDCGGVCRGCSGYCVAGCRGGDSTN